MSDEGRKDFAEKAKEAMTPDSSKTTYETVHDEVTGMTDKAAREVQPNDSKSITQEIADKAGHGKDHHKQGGTGGSMLDSAKHALGMDKDKELH